MAHGSLLSGTLSGRIGDVIFKRVNGKQVSYAYVKPSNPNTIGQLKTRCQFRSVGLAYRLFKGLASGSFSCKTAQALGKFKKYNQKLSPFLEKDEYELRRMQGAAKIAPYIISNGSLPNFWLDHCQLYPVCHRDNQQTVGLSCTIVFTPPMRAAVLEEFESVGHYEGSLGDLIMRIADYLGYSGAHLGLFLATGPEADRFGYYYNNYTYAEFCRDSMMQIPVNAQFTTQDHQWTFNINGSPVAIEDFTLTAESTQAEIKIYIGSATNIPAQGHPSAAAIIAVERNGGINVSTSQLVMQDWMQNPYSAYFQPAYTEYASRTYAPEKKAQGDQILDKKKG